MAPAPLSISFVDRDTQDHSSQSVYTFTAKALGAAAVNRYILVGIFSWKYTPRTITAVTVGGIAAQIVPGQSSSGHVFCAFAVAKVPTGTTGDIVVTFSGTTDNCQLGVWRVLNQAAWALLTDFNESNNSFSMSATIPKNGVAAALTYMTFINFDASVTWTNLTENWENTTSDSSNDNYSGASSATAGLATRTVHGGDDMDDSGMALCIGTPI